MPKKKSRRSSSGGALRCVAYARVSTAEQAETGASLDAQLYAIRDYVAQRGYVLVDEYVERGASGTSDKRRPAFVQMMEHILGASPKVKADAVVVYQTSRFMRDSFQAKRWKRRLLEDGIRVISTQQDVGDSESGKLIEEIYEAFDGHESRMIGERTRSGMRQVARHGFFPGSRPPFGYMTERVSVGNTLRTRLVPHAREAETLREIFRLYIAGDGAKSVARELNRRGVRQRNGAPWGKSSVLRVIEERAPTGIYEWGKRSGRQRQPAVQEDWIEIPVEPIIPVELWESAQQLRDERDPVQSPGRTSSSPMLLAGLVECGRCGSKYILETSGKLASDGSRRYRYYNCRSFLKKGKEACVGLRYAEGLLDEAVLDHLASEVFTLQRVRAILRDLVEEAGILRQRTAEQRKLLRRELGDIERKIGRWVALIESGQLPPEAAGNRLVELRTRKRELEEALTKIVPQRPPPPHLYSHAAIEKFQVSLRSAFKEGGVVAKNYLQFIVDRIVIEGNHVRIVGKSAEAMELMERSSKASPPGELTEDGEVLASVPTWLREQDSNLRLSG